MAKITEVQEVSLHLLKPYANNAKEHSQDQIEMLKNSIKEFGFLSPCLIDKDYNLIAGHGRLEAAKQLHLSAAPCVFIEGLTDEERRAYILADNRLYELGEWNDLILRQEVEEIDFDFTAFDIGFDDTEQEPEFVKAATVECPRCGHIMEA